LSSDSSLSIAEVVPQVLPEKNYSGKNMHFCGFWQLYGHGSDEDDWEVPKIVPKCFYFQLKTCSLIDYKGTKCELHFAEYVLNNANLLRTMTINASSKDLTIKYQMLMDLSVSKGLSYM